ncbi:putative receptor-like protein kinase [Camellia lanceoleosa]|uniref:Receptor-like protein kinase n=1 Tax=Camellia lanceoleosa TaxID=1840588 RepID=A0ACC0G5M8_9ERIC|nr:putative receptor-like protein kinase [Camellia lanceoleosa]
MDDVLGNLRYALQLQETWQNSNDQFSTVKSPEAVPSSDGTVIVELARRGDIDEMSLGIIGDSDYFSENCVCDMGIERPSMDDVLGNLWYALQLQETWQNSNDQFSTVKSPEAVPSSDYFSGNLAR